MRSGHTLPGMAVAAAAARWWQLPRPSLETEGSADRMHGVWLRDVPGGSGGSGTR